MSRRRTYARLSLIVAIVAALMLTGASSAFAAPNVPTMSFDDLRQALTTTGPLQGYMRTVVNEPLSGSDITTIDLTVEAVPLSGTAYDTNSLIAFEASAAVASGMSGSPIYVHTAGGDKLIGAVSYGSAFTIGGGGLATPIEAMSRIETQRGSAVVPLSRPVISSNGVYNKVIVAPNPQDYAGAAAEGAFVARPLATVSLGGLRTTSAGYKAFAKNLAARGITPASEILPLGGTAAEPSFSAEMTGGASVGVWASRGDLWYGGIGTVTYVNGNNLLAFGHPAFQTGTTALDMTNASVEKIWQSSDTPFKLADPGALCGAITQDRSAGILGKLGTYANETTITARAIDADGVETETSSTVYVPRQLFTTGFADSSLAGVAAYMAGSKLYDASSQSGSAHTTTTVVVKDTHDTTFTITIPNFSDSSYDIAYDASYDVQNAISTLQSTLEWGTDKLTVVSIDLVGEYSTQRKLGTIVDVAAPNGLKVGDNRIVVSALVYGQEDTATVNATLTIPAGTAVGGSVSAYAMGYGDDEMSNILTSFGMNLGVNDSGGRQSIAQLSHGLNETLPNNTIEIVFSPAQTSSGFSEDGPTKPLSTKPIVVDVPAEWPTSGSADVNVTTINAQVDPNPIDYDDWADISGVVNGPSSDTTVTLYATTAGGSETLLATTTATLVDGELAFDFAPETSFTTNTTFRVHVDGDGSWSGADTTVQLGVRAITSLRTSASTIRRGRTVKLTASVFPATSAGGTVVFERLSGKRWVRIASKTLVRSGSSAVASVTWKPGKGKQKVRARYLGGTYNYGNTTGTRTITVR